MRNLARIARVTQMALGVISLFAITSCSSETPDVGTLDPKESFITTWRVTESDLKITIPTRGGGYDYTVDWGDGSELSTGQTENASHTYEEEGTYTVSIAGDFPRIFFNNEGDRKKIIAINQWGPISWSSMELAFTVCTNLEGLATDSPVLSRVERMSSMFRNARKFNQDISNWDVSKVKDMSSMFQTAHAFNQDISGWGVSKVTNMNSMFRTATSFDQDLSAWNIESLTNARNIFSGVELSSENYDSLLMGWSTKAVTATDTNQIPFHGGKSTPTSDSAEAKTLLESKFWDITDSLTHFVTTWDLRGFTEAADLTIYIQICSLLGRSCPGLSYNYTVDWGDESKSTGQTDDATHTYKVGGIYKIKISGDFYGTGFAGSGSSKSKITEINQWGTSSGTPTEPFRVVKTCKYLLQTPQY